MSAKKGLMIGCGLAGLGVLVCGGVIGTIVYMAFALTRPAVESADRFLGLLSEGKIQEAYASSAAALRSQQTEDAFAAEVQRLGLTDYASSSWTTRKVENDEATLEGSVTTKKGGTIPVTVKLVKEGNDWRVLSVTSPQAGVARGDAGKQVPTDDELRRLTRQTLLDFNDAVKAKDFAAFHGKISRRWQEQITAADLTKAFQVFIDKEIDIGAVRDLAPVFDEPPAINADGLLVVSGYYPTKPNRVVFELKYTYEHPGWKLFGIKVQLKS